MNNRANAVDLNWSELSNIHAKYKERIIIKQTDFVEKNNYYWANFYEQPYKASVASIISSLVELLNKNLLEQNFLINLEVF